MKFHPELNVGHILQTLAVIGSVMAAYYTSSRRSSRTPRPSKPNAIGAIISIATDPAAVDTARQDALAALAALRADT